MTGSSKNCEQKGNWKKLFTQLNLINFRKGDERILQLENWENYIGCGKNRSI